MAEPLKPPIYNDAAAYYSGEKPSNHPIWPFALRWQDERRWDAWVKKGFDGTQLVTIGTVGALNKEGDLIEPGVRAIASIAQIAHVAERMKEHGLGIPQPTFLYPANANATANNGSVKANLAYGRAYHQMATDYFHTFHPELPPPMALVDKVEGMEELLTVAPIIANELNPDNIKTLLSMAEKYYMDSNADRYSMATRSTAYFLVHFYAYGLGRNHNYLDNGVPRIFVVPQSESLFQDMLEQETELVARYLPITPLSNDDSGDTIVGYSTILTTPPYFIHHNEPTIMSINGHFPTANELSRRGGINGNVQQEILNAVTILRQDTKERLGQLINEVIHPYREALLEMQYFM